MWFACSTAGKQSARNCSLSHIMENLLSISSFFIITSSLPWQQPCVKPVLAKFITSLVSVCFLKLRPLKEIVFHGSLSVFFNWELNFCAHFPTPLYNLVFGSVRILSPSFCHCGHLAVISPTFKFFSRIYWLQV